MEKTAADTYLSFIILESWVSVATQDKAGNVSHPAAQIGNSNTATNSPEDFLAISAQHSCL